ncbi:MAG: FeoA family protein [Bacteroidota bacterium]|nr:FeoA family protein [Bacteroidota bacterium]
MFPLDQLALGQKALIKSIETDFLPLKLIEMGCLPGNEISLLHSAPFKDPLYFKIDQAHLAIRKEVAQYIVVKPLLDD